MVNINIPLPDSCASCPLSVRHFGKLYCPPLDGRVGNEGKDSRCPLVDADDHNADVNNSEKPNNSDTIYRQVAIDALNIGAELLKRVLDDTDVVGIEREKYAWGLGLIESCISDMKELPTAQPEIIRCKDCKHQRVFHYTDKRFKDPDRYVYGCDLMPDGCYLNCFDSYCSEAERRTDEADYRKE